jgi:hypothetical protein
MKERDHMGDLSINGRMIQKHRLKNYIVKTWIHKAQNKVLWWAHINIVMNIRDP